MGKSKGIANKKEKVVRRMLFLSSFPHQQSIECQTRQTVAIFVIIQVPLRCEIFQASVIPHSNHFLDCIAADNRSTQIEEHTIFPLDSICYFAFGKLFYLWPTSCIFPHFNLFIRKVKAKTFTLWQNIYL